MLEDINPLRARGHSVLESSTRLATFVNQPENGTATASAALSNSPCFLPFRPIHSAALGSVGVV